LDTFKSFESQLYTVNDKTFKDIALQLFRYQAAQNEVYKAYLQLLGITVDKIRTLEEIPFLPISFFKTQALKTGAWQAATTFSSSGTTGSTSSQHHVRDVSFYLRHSKKCFEHFFGSVSDYHFLALLPSYLDRKNSSLVVMMDYFIRESRSTASGFYLDNLNGLVEDLKKLQENPRKVILWGVSFALLDLAEKYPDLSHCIVFETGGMKGKRREMTRFELHQALKAGLNVSKIFSEYGMTELFSQAYSAGNERFSCPPWLKMIGRDLADPFQKGLQNETAGINVIDLANYHTISFIETEDLGKIYADGTFEIMGRIDNSDVRGCNLMVE
jgi:phenylacetate-coenzyme A ligase PaaK-like adenylate-forming protein